MQFSKLLLICLCFLSVTSYAAATQTITQGAIMQASSQSIADKNLAEGQAFLKANKTKPGVVTLPDGLQYKIIKQGTGAQPTVNDTVTVHYKGTFIDGKEFDSSYKYGQPISFPVGGVIPGWVEALQLMKVGSEWELFIPANLAYGAAGAPGAIEPNKTLIFKVTLIDIKKK